MKLVEKIRERIEWDLKISKFERFNKRSVAGVKGFGAIFAVNGKTGNPRGAGRKEEENSNASGCTKTAQALSSGD